MSKKSNTKVIGELVGGFIEGLAAASRATNKYELIQAKQEALVELRDMQFQLTHLQNDIRLARMQYRTDLIRKAEIELTILEAEFAGLEAKIDYLNGVISNR